MPETWFWRWCRILWFALAKRALIRVSGNKRGTILALSYVTRSVHLVDPFIHPACLSFQCKLGQLKEKSAKFPSNTTVYNSIVFGCAWAKHNNIFIHIQQIFETNEVADSVLSWPFSFFQRGRLSLGPQNGFIFLPAGKEIFTLMLMPQGTRPIRHD